MSSQTRPLAHSLRKQLLGQPDLYVESVGKTDMLTFNDVMQAPDGVGTVIRLVMGATVQMPIRAITYVDTALRLAEVIPCEQVQVVHTTRVGEVVNGVNRERSHQEAFHLDVLAFCHAYKTFPDVAEKLVLAEDAPFDILPYAEIAEEAFTKDPTTATVLQEKSAKHGGSAVHYAAAHFAVHDTTALELDPTIAACPDPVTPQRIVSVGCQQERTFYRARMAMRELYEGSDMVAAGQVFTRHVAPPYVLARGGEQTHADALSNEVDMTQFTDASAARDMQHFLDRHQERME